VSTAELQAEARARWGASAEFQESQRRIDGYDPSTWERIRAEAASVEQRFAAACAAGTAADDLSVAALAEEHRTYLSRWFYSCSVERHRALGEMYVSDERFARHFDALLPGLAVYVRDAIVANAERLGS
jgi:hypothetical protein